MQATPPRSDVRPPSTTEFLADCQSCPCCRRIGKIAIAILASLAGFVFLPFGIALTLTAVVTVGAVGYCGDDTRPQNATPKPPIESDSEEDSEPDSEQVSVSKFFSASPSEEVSVSNAPSAPTKVRRSGLYNVYVSFSNQQIVKQFRKSHTYYFPDCVLWPVEGDDNSVRIEVHHNHKSTKKADFILAQLKEIFGESQMTTAIG